MIQIVNLITWISVLLLLYAAWTDFSTWKIPNTLVLALVTLYALRAVAVMLGSGDAGAVRCFSSTGIGGDAGAGLLMFVLGVVLWAFRCSAPATPSSSCRSAFSSAGTACCRFRYLSPRPRRRDTC